MLSDTLRNNGTAPKDFEILLVLSRSATCGVLPYCPTCTCLNATIVVDVVVRLLLRGRLAGGRRRRHVPAGMAVCAALLRPGRFLRELFPRSRAPDAPGA